MHIVYVFAPGGGPEAAVKTLLPWLEQAGHRVSIIYLAPSDKVTSSFPRSVRVEYVQVGQAHYYLARIGIIWHALPLRARAWEYARAAERALIRINHQQKVDLVEVIEGVPISSHGYPWRVIVRAHSSDWTVRYFCNDGDRSNDKWLVAQESNQLRAADKVSAISRHLADHLSEFCHFPRESLEVIPYPINTDEFHPGERSLMRDAPVIVSIGRLEKRKGMDILLRAVTNGVWERFPDLKIYLLGAEGDLTCAALLSLVPPEKRSQVSFPGFVDRASLPDLYRRSTLYATATLYESFGYTILEAMACGTAVVATRVGGIPELVEEGETGLLVPPRDEKALAEAIIGLLEDTPRRERMGQKGRAKAVKEFAVERIATRTMEFYFSHARIRKPNVQ